MISTVLYAIQQGWRRVVASHQLLFIVLILFLFPLLFIVVLDRFNAIAYSNVERAEQARIGAIHDGIAVALPHLETVEIKSDLLLRLQEQNADINGMILYNQYTENQLTIVAATDSSLIGATTTPMSILTTSAVDPGGTISAEMQTDVGRVIQAARRIDRGDTTVYIFSEHNRSQFDQVMQQRLMEGYLLLSVFLVFIIGLAYWIARQTDWQNRHASLAATLKERDLFSNMIAHEFRTPLTAIKGYASFLQESTDISTDDKRYADTIRESAERLVLLVNDFLEVARIQSGRMQLEYSEIDVRDVIATVVDSLHGKAEEKSLQLVYSPELTSQLLHTDKNRFIQILTNIISNSIKYTDKGIVEVMAITDRRMVTIRVKDTGMGISATDQQKLFTPFSRVGGVEHSATTGTGLGMWITKQLIELLGGTIAVESIKDVGTHVVLKFPLAD